VVIRADEGRLTAVEEPRRAGGSLHG
jgi:hypothetical protein